MKKENRRVKDLDNPEIKDGIKKVLKLLDEGKNEDAYEELLTVIKLLSDEAISKFF